MLLFKLESKQNSRYGRSSWIKTFKTGWATCKRTRISLTQCTLRQKHLKVKNYVTVRRATKGKNIPRKKLHFEPRPEKASLKAKLRLIRQIYACQASSEKNPRKNINTDGNEIADLQETMRSDSSAVSPHLSWQQGLGGCALAKPAGALGRCGLALGAACTKS